MSDQDTNEQYHYPGNEEGETYEVQDDAGAGYATQGPEALQALLQNKRLMISVGIGTLLFAGVQIVNFVRSHKKPAVETVVVAKQETKVPVQETHPADYATAKPAPSGVEKPKIDVLASLRKKIEEKKQVAQATPAAPSQKATENAHAIVEVKNELKQVSGHITKITESSASMAERLDNLSRQLDKLVALENQRKAKAAAEQLAKTPPKVYHIEALVEGRAWIKTEGQDAMTVAVGDRIQDYGEVLDILPARGVVKTSSGRSIYFGK